MDNQTNNPETAWVDRKLANLVPPGDWYPDSKRAFDQFLKRRDRREAASSPRWIRLSMAAAILASIGLVVTLLPWHALWRPAELGKGRPTETLKAAAPPSPQQEHRLVAKRGTDVNPYGSIGPATEPKSTDEARRAHIQGTVAALQQPAPPAPEKEQKPVERVGNGVSAPRTIPPMTEPDYTDEARQAHIQGTVILGVIVSADGTGKVVKVIRGLDPGLDQKAIETFEKWRFEPGKKDGKPVDVELQVEINFHLY